MKRKGAPSDKGETKRERKNADTTPNTPNEIAQTRGLPQGQTIKKKAELIPERQGRSKKTRL